MERYLCIHGHFYQPPRENPWLEAVELQESAYPYHDWNDRITDECYAANARSRILDGDGRIERIVNNYAGISYNFGPTLLSWLEAKRPEVYRQIIEADAQSAERFSGHGSAIAQVYGHIILPLAHPRDVRTQVAWGVRDFVKRFGRKPEGMWLSESAVSTPVLEELAEQEITFTILAPRQAAAFRPLGEEAWTEVGGDVGIDPRQPYLCRLPSGRTINLFFYDGPVSQAVAFEHLLEGGEKFAERLAGAFEEGRQGPQLVHIATDGETYGHHHRHGDMALAYALHHIESSGIATLTNYGEYLERFPPQHEARIVENSSWSCSHGVERWKSDCGCSSGRAGWNQQWRGPLREAFDWLRDAVAPAYERAAKGLLKDPWAARDAYVDVLLERTPEGVASFLETHGAGSLDDGRTVRALKLLEMQRHLMQMYTSCGWFFDEVSGIETVQVIQYAARALQLARDVLDTDLEPELLERLERVPSNIKERPNGRTIYESFVRPAVIDAHKLAAHYAVRSLFEPYEETARVYAYEVERLDTHAASAGRARMLVGRARFTSSVTRETAEITFGGLHLGDHILNAGVREYQGEQAYGQLVERTRAAFSKADYPVILREMDEAFGGSSYTLHSLFRDERQSVLDRIMEQTLGSVDAAYRQVYEAHAPLLRFLSGIDLPVPKALRVTAEIVLNSGLIAALRPESADLGRAKEILKEATEERVKLDEPAIAYAIRKLIERRASDLTGAPSDAALDALREAATLAIDVPFEVPVDAAQNAVYDLLRNPGAWPTESETFGATLGELASAVRLKVES